MSESKLIVVTPAKNEAVYLPVTIASMLKQSVLPSEWIIVDDGSTDGTGEIARSAAAAHPWITVTRRDSDPGRRVGLATVHAIQIALAQTRVVDFDYLCVIDADVDLPPAYFASLLSEFDRQSALGIAAGQIYERGLGGKLQPMRGAPEATAGAVKCWRRRCFEEIGGVIDEAGWDGIDQYQAALHGWSTRTFDGEGFRVLHLRPVGSSHKGVLHGRLRRGRSGYHMGSHPLWMLASSLFHLSDPPILLGSLFTLWGYFQAQCKGVPRIDNGRLIAFIRARQLAILRAGFCSPLLRFFSSVKESLSWQPR